MKTRVLIITAGQLATCPRMVKAADALSEDYDVRVVSAQYGGWPNAGDQELRKSRTWRWSVVGCEGGGTYVWTGARSRATQAMARALGPRHAPWIVATRAFARLHAELVDAALAEPFDFVYGGTTGALAAVAESAKRAGTPYAVDFEDFHRGEHGSGGELFNALAARVEQSVAPQAAFVTSASAAIADAYRSTLGVEPVVINNTFPLPASAPDFSRRSETLRLYWFSQTIGPGRGLEDAVAACGQAGIAATLSLRGRPLTGYIDGLSAFAAAQAPSLRLEHHNPAPADEMVDAARHHDVGLALEQTAVVNRRLCLTNKAFTYMLAGSAVAMTDTPGQHALGVDLGAGAALVPPGDVSALAVALLRWASDATLLAGAKQAAWDAAVRRWHWEHPLERGALLELVRHSLS